MSVHFLDVTFEFALRDGLEKRLHFIGLAAALQFYAPVRQVFNPADDVIAAGEILCRPAEADPLHAALIKNLPAAHAKTPSAFGLPVARGTDW